MNWRILSAQNFPAVVKQYLATVIVIVTFSGFVLAQNRNTISGFVFTSERRVISNIPVEVMNEVYQVLARTRTDGSGRYFFGGLSSGKFVIRVLPYGTNFEEQSQEVDIINISRPGGSTSDMAYKDFYLKLRKTGPDVRTMSGTVFAQEVPEEAQKLYEKGLAELGSNQTDAGMRSLLEAVKKFPEFYLALERLGREYIIQQNYEYARAVFTKVVSVNDRSYTGWYGLGFAAYGLKESGIAVEAATKATTLDQSSISAFLLLGISQRQAKNYDASEKAFQTAKKLANGTSPDVHWNLALLYGNDMKKYKEAADELDQYVKIAPANANLDEVRKLITRFRGMAATKS